MAEKVFGITAGDTKRLSRVLDASERRGPAPRNTRTGYGRQLDTHLGRLLSITSSNLVTLKPVWYVDDPTSEITGAQDVTCYIGYPIGGGAVTAHLDIGAVYEWKWVPMASGVRRGVLVSLLRREGC